MKICVISCSRDYHAPKRIMEEGEKKGHEMYNAVWTDICLSANESGVTLGDGSMTLDEFDAIIPRNDRYKVEVDGELVSRDSNIIFKLVLEEARNKKIFFLNSEYFSQYQSLDKTAQQFFFFKNNLPGIGTYFFSDKDKFKDMKGDVQFPLVAKISKGSLGKTVFKLENEKELEEFLNARHQDGDSFLFQDYHPIRHDYRVIVVGKKVLGIMKRTAQKGEWRTNIALGGSAERGVSDREMERISLEVASKMKFDYVGIDILEKDGKYYIIETNSLPIFEGFEKSFPEVNVAESLIKLAEKKVKKSCGKWSWLKKL